MQDIIGSVAAQDSDSFNSEGDVELLMLKKVSYILFARSDNSVILSRVLLVTNEATTPTILQSHRSVWENMQTVAEEKRKAYRCVCWSAEPINADTLKVRECNQLEQEPFSFHFRQFAVCWRLLRSRTIFMQMLESYSSCTGNADEEGRPCLKVIQPIPLPFSSACTISSDIPLLSFFSTS